MTEDEPFVDDRPRSENPETRQARLRDGFIRYEAETRLDEVQDGDE